MKNLANRITGIIVHLLTVIVIFSKYGWIVPLKNKKGESVAKAFKQLLKERISKFLWTDKEK